MDIKLKELAIESLKELDNVSPEDVANIIETVQKCYLSEEMTNEEQFLVKELESFIVGINN